jgi:hypothetical protein
MTKTTIVSIDSGKVFYKIQHPSILKALMKPEVEEMLFNIIKAINNKPTLNYEK